MKCLNCQEEVPEHVRSCVVCGRDVGYPNVRAAVRTEEVEALELRMNEAEKNADSLGCKSILENFRDAVAQSEAVVCCPLGKLSELVSSENQLYQTFYQAVGSCQRSFQSEPFSVVKSEPPCPHDWLISTPSFPTFPRSL